MNTRVSTPLLSLFTIAALLSAVGCSSGIEKRSYQVSVRNDSDTPVTVWLTKAGNVVYEREWRSPEDLAIESRRADEKIVGSIVNPGQVGEIGPMMGQFYKGGYAVLRVYYGQHTISSLLSIKEADPDRSDYELAPGFNGFTITSDKGALYIHRGNGGPSAAAPSGGSANATSAGAISPAASGNATAQTK